MRYLIGLLFLLLTLQVFAQTQIEPEQLTIEDGLAQGYVAAIIQDREGFMWFSTKNGLNRYDGREFEVFTNDPNDPYSLSNDWVTSIVEHGDFLLVGGQDCILNLFHKRTKKFYRIPLVSDGIQKPL
ncbi:MAG: two-component regulator propeller domain-containing protein, partial [Bacteroidota bacterium]